MLGMGDSAPRKGAGAMTFVGCGLHTRMQQVAVLDTGAGEVSEHRLVHAGMTVEAFYAAFAVANTSASGRRRALWRARSLAAPSAAFAVNGWTWIPKSATSCLTTETASSPRRQGSTRTSAYALAGR